MTAELTARDKVALEFLRAYSRAFQVMPTQNQIAAYLGLNSRSTASAALCLNHLERAGLIRRARGRWYGIELVEPKNDNPTNCPHCGQARSA